MKQVEGIWLPDEDTHFEKMFSRFPKVGGKATYQYDKLRACLTHGCRFRTAADVGAHVGLWARILCDHFEHVIAFEPVFFDCLRRNLEDKTNVTVHPVALSDRSGSAVMDVSRDNSGRTHVTSVASGDGELVPVATLDSYRLQDVDLIKVDVEGWEFHVLRGAEETMLRCKPVVICEQKGHDREHYGGSRDCVRYLESLGAGVLEVAGKDVILGWRE